MHKRDTGQHVLTATTSDEQKAEQVREWINEMFDGNDSAAVWYALNSQMQREQINEEHDNVEK